MEEQVGALWHRLITRASERRYPQAAVRLEDMAVTLGIVFRALGGDAGLEVKAGDDYAHGARRGLLARIAGVGNRMALAWRDDRALLLPPVIDRFPDPAINRDLYLWLAALATGAAQADDDWLNGNQRLTRSALARFPGLESRYRRLVQAHLAERPDPDRLPAAEAEAERAIRQALTDPGSVSSLIQGSGLGYRPPLPVPLWLHPDPPLPLGAAGAPPGTEDQERTPEDASADLGRRRRQGERAEMPHKDAGFIGIRMENILTWGEYVRVDRATDDEDDLDRAKAAAEDMDRIAVARDRKASGARLRFDLDLPAANEDDLVLADGERLPEWDWKQRRLLPDHCRIQEMLAAEAPPCPLPEHLRRTARRLRDQFQALAPARTWLRGLPDGQAIDLDAYLRFATDRRAGAHGDPNRLYADMRSGARDLACLLLADLSLSTDTWIDDRGRVIDAIRDSLFLFGESLAATGDRFAMLGFSSRSRDPVRVHQIKTFAEPYGAVIRGRIQAIKPGYYTRLGAGIRHAAQRLAREGASRRLLLILTDSKPNDLDRYEGRWGIEDTRHAVGEARRQGLEPFCVTIDPEGNDYLPHLFGSGGYVVIRHPAELPARLPLLYARLTAGG
jgi:nitric oxide reductase NorD protein